MTQSSGPWDGSSFAEDEWRELFRALTNGRMKDGIANSLEITRSVSNRDVTIGAGKAIVQGMLYVNTANVVFTIATPTGSNQRVDYIILKYDASQSLANRIVLAVKQGAEALSGAIPPALTQSSTGIWEHPLAVIGPYGSGVISAAPFAELSPVASRRFYVPIGSYADPNAMPGLAANFRDEAFDSNGRVWQLNSSGIWELKTSDVMTPLQTESGTDQATSATYPTWQAGSPVVGLSFVAPQSGQVFVSVYGYLGSNQNGRRGLVSYEIRTGSSIGSGTIIQAAWEYNAVQNSAAVTSGGISWASATARRLHTGLTPGASYNVRTMHTHTGGSITVYHRRITVESA